MQFINELSSIFRDDVCVLSVSGTAAVINPKYTTDTSTTSSRVLVAAVGSAPKDINQPAERSDVIREVAQSLPINSKMLSTPTTITDIEHETELVSTKSNKETGCTLCHMPYRKSSTFDMHTKKCSTCK